MKNNKKFKDELSKRDSKRLVKKSSKKRKSSLNYDEYKKPKFKNYYLNEEE